jgi:hypothetical protein
MVAVAVNGLLLFYTPPSLDATTARAERVDIVQWHAEPLRYIAAALGLSYMLSASSIPSDTAPTPCLARSITPPLVAGVPSTCCLPPP